MLRNASHLVGPKAALGGLRLRGCVGHGQIQRQSARVLEKHGKRKGKMANLWGKHGTTMEKNAIYSEKHRN